MVWQYFLGDTFKERNDLHDSFQENDISTLFQERFQGNTSLQLTVRHLNPGEGAVELKLFPTEQQRSFCAQVTHYHEAHPEAVHFSRSSYEEQRYVILGSGLHMLSQIHKSCRIKSNSKHQNLKDLKI